MPIIPQNNSLLSNAAASILGGKQIVSLDNTDDIRATAVAYVEVIAPFCGDASSKEIEKAITTSEKTIKTVFVNGITFEFDKKTFGVYVVNSYDLSQLQNFYGDVNGAELPSGYFVVVVPISEVKADALKGNVASAGAPEVLNVDTGKAIKESVKVGDRVEGIQGVDGGYKGKVKSIKRDTRGRVLVTFIDDKGNERETYDFNVKKLIESNISERINSVTYTQAIQALAGSAEDEDISVLKRYADCVSIIFRMTPQEVMKDLLPEDDTYKAKDDQQAIEKAYKNGVPIEYSKDGGKTWKYVGSYDPVAFNPMAKVRIATVLYRVAAK